MVEGTVTEIHNWEQIVAQAGGSAEIAVEPDVHRISGRVLSLTAFGGDFETGERIYLTMKELAKELLESSYDARFWLIPFYRSINPSTSALNSAARRKLLKFSLQSRVKITDRSRSLGQKNSDETEQTYRPDDLES